MFSQLTNFHNILWETYPELRKQKDVVTAFRTCILDLAGIWAIYSRVQKKCTKNTYIV